MHHASIRRRLLDDLANFDGIIRNVKQACRMQLPRFFDDVLRTSRTRAHLRLRMNRGRVCAALWLYEAPPSPPLLLLHMRFVCIAAVSVPASAPAVSTSRPPKVGIGGPQEVPFWGAWAYWGAGNFDPEVRGEVAHAVRHYELHHQLTRNWEKTPRTSFALFPWG